MILWIGFFICSAAIVYSGTKLSKYGDIIAEKTGLGRTWIGVVMVASVTSLPELITGISSVTITDAPNIAIGNILGACVVNMAMFVVIDSFYKVPVSSKVHYGNILAAGFGLILISLTGISIFLGDRLIPLGWIGPYSLIIPLIYFIGIRLIYSYGKRQIAALIKEEAEELRYKEIPLKRAIFRYIVNAIVVIVAAIFLPEIGKGIAETTGLGQTFVGVIFIAITTTLPEMVVSISAVKMGAVDLAVGNLFGSNMFNIFILAIDDLFFTKGAILSFVEPGHLVSVFFSMLMISIMIIGLTYRAERKRLFLSWDSVGIALSYIMNLLLLYVLR